MHMDLTGGRPIKCSKCGSTNAVKPVNNRDIAIQCGDCGHTKLTHEAEMRKHRSDYGLQGAVGWTHTPDKDPTF